VAPPELAADGFAPGARRSRLDRPRLGLHPGAPRRSRRVEKDSTYPPGALVPALGVPVGAGRRRSARRGVVQAAVQGARVKARATLGTPSSSNGGRAVGQCRRPSVNSSDRPLPMHRGGDDQCRLTVCQRAAGPHDDWSRSRRDRAVGGFTAPSSRAPRSTASRRMASQLVDARVIGTGASLRLVALGRERDDRKRRCARTRIHAGISRPPPGPHHRRASRPSSRGRSRSRALSSSATNLPVSGVGAGPEGSGMAAARQGRHCVRRGRRGVLARPTASRFRRGGSAAHA
jgi:hypothetical protein